MTSFYRAALALSLLSLVACTPTPGHSTVDETEAALDLIMLEVLEAHVRYLADDAREGRASGEPGYDDAANYVAEQFATMGVAPAGSDGWYQPVELRSYLIDGKSATFILHRGGQDTALTYRDDFSMSADAVRESTSVRAEVVYVGYGVHAPTHGYSDYEGIDVKGKIVAGFRGAPEQIEGSERAYYASSRVKAEEAISRGAIGSITLRSRKNEERRSWEETKTSIGKTPRMAWVNEDGEASGYFAELRGSASLSIAAAETVFGLSPSKRTGCATSIFHSRRHSQRERMDSRNAAYSLRPVSFDIPSMIWAQASFGRSCPMPSININSLFGMQACVSRPHSTGTRGSATP